MSAREVADHLGIVDRNERLIRAVAALDLRQFAHAPDKLVLARRGVSALACLRAQKSSRKDVLTPAKQRAEQPHFVDWCPRYRRLKCKGRPYMDLRFGVQRSQLGPERGESMSRLSLLGFKHGEKSLLMRDGVAQRFAAHPLSGRLVYVCFLLISVVLHDLSAGRALHRV